MLTADELAGMQTQLDASLPSTCTISRSALSADGQGGRTVVWSTVATVACRLSPMPTVGNPDQTDAERLGTTTPWIVTLPDATDVRNVDRVVIGARTFEVQSVVTPRSWEICTRAYCIEVL